MVLPSLSWILGGRFWELQLKDMQATVLQPKSKCEPVQVIEDAGREFLGGPEQALLAIARAELSLARGDADAAFSMLK